MAFNILFPYFRINDMSMQSELTELILPVKLLNKRLLNPLYTCNIYIKCYITQPRLIFFSLFMTIVCIGVAPITQLRTCVIKIEPFKGGHPMCQSDSSYHKELLLKERIRSLWEQILTFKRSSHFEKGRHGRESLLDPVVSL